MMFKGKIISAYVSKVRLPNGIVIEVDHVDHPGGAAIVARNNDGQICLIKQYRHIVDDWIWEVPAGKLELGEKPLVTAQRELLEEAGVLAKSWVSLGEIYTSPGVFKEVIYLFLATELQDAQPCPAHDELFEVHWLSMDDALAWAKHGKIFDAKSIAAIIRAHANFDD